MNGNFKAAYLSILLLAGCSAKNDSESVSQGQTPIAENEYPQLVLTLPSGEEIDARSMKGKNIFILFQPDCDHCQHEAEEISQRLAEFKDYSLYFISSTPIAEILQFASTYGLHNKERVYFAFTPTESVLDNYGAISAPSIYIYDQGKLKQKFNGQTPVDDIVNSL